MDIIQVISAISALFSALAAVLAWIAKIKWAKEFSEAKDETIRAKEAQIQIKEAQLQTVLMTKDQIIQAKDAQIETLDKELKLLQELSPMKLREYNIAVRSQLEEYNDLVCQKLEDAKTEIANKNSEIESLKVEGSKNLEVISKLTKEKEKISSLAEGLENTILDISTLQKSKNKNHLVLYLFLLSNTKLNDQYKYYSELSKLLSKDVSQDFKLKYRFLETCQKSIKYDVFKDEMDESNIKLIDDWLHLLIEKKNKNILPSQFKKPKNDKRDDNDKDDEGDLIKV